MIVNMSERYNQIVGLVNEAIGLEPLYSREQARQWFQTKTNMATNGMIDKRVYTAFMRMARSASGGFIRLDCMQKNLASFMTAVKMVEEQRPRTANNRVITESRNKVLDNLVANRMITGIVRHAVEDLYKLNSKVSAHA